MQCQSNNGMAQQQITKFFSLKSKMSREIAGENRKRISVRPLSELCKTPVKVERNGYKQSSRENDAISLLSSDEDQDQENCVKTTPGAAGASAQSKEKGDSSRISNKEPPGKHTPKKQPLTSVPGGGDRPSLGKFFSPTKKRSVKKQTPKKTAASRTILPTPKKLFADGDDLLSEACAAQDDKTKFLLQIVYDFVKDDSLVYLVGEEGRDMLMQYMRMRAAGARLICRLYWRKERWYRVAELLSIVNTGKDQKEDSQMFQELLDKKFLVQGSSHELDLEDYNEGLLNANDLKSICKFLHIKSNSKKDSRELLQSYCQSTQNINKYFGNKNAKNSNKERVLKLCAEAAGECYKMSERCRELFYRLYLLSYLGMDFDILRTKQLELLLINVKTQRETFPVDPNMPVDKPSLVFPTRYHFDTYMTAHLMYEDFLQTTASAKKISIMQQAYTFYKEIEIVEFRSVQPWLRRFTPAYLYIKIIEEGLPELKKGKDPTQCQLAVDMLTTLLSQDLFRQHKYANWYDEKALILHNYLHQPDLSAKVVVEGFSSELSEEVKDLLRPRAKKLANQKNIVLEEEVRATLLAHANKQHICESSLPSVHFYKQAMDNTTKGKVLFESRNEDGRTISSVENVAISCYQEKGEYTHGRHSEGRIVTSLFFLLFWDIIYSKPKDVQGIFLSRYQSYPLDMFYDSFYESRKAAIDVRLRLIENSSIEDVVQMMNRTWSSRPEGEHGGINREVGWEVLAGVARCLRPAALTAICRRLAQQYRYSCSGFPDLTLWNPTTGKIKFAEVKSDSDKPSMKQMQWMKYLLANGVDTEFCYIGTRGTHAPLKASPV